MKNLNILFFLLIFGISIDAKINQSFNNKKKIIANSPTHKNSRTILINNQITSDNLTYHHTCCSLTPKFNLMINDEPYEEDEEKELMIYDDVLKVAYNYEFTTWGICHKKGKEELTFSVPSHISKLKISFSSWHDKPHIVIPGATLVKK